jgi:glycosyltransferase involved in cell wall biosynthesis
VRRRVLFVGRTRYRLPLSESQRRKWDALGERFEYRVLGTATDRSQTDDSAFLLHRPVTPRALDAAAFYGALPFRIARELRAFRPDAVVAQSPYEAFAALAARRLARVRTAVIAEVHGDWRTFGRLYGSPARRLLGPLTDRLAATALRRSDGVRTLSAFTSGIVREAGIEPTLAFTTWSDLGAFAARPVQQLPREPTALAVGVLERYKNIDGIVAAWRLAAPRAPHAKLRLVGEGSRRALVEALLRELPEQTAWTPRLRPEEVATALDDSWCLLLPSRSEGTPRIAMEALCRGRAIVGGRAGGTPDVVRHEENGLLLEPEDVPAIADALVRLLSDRGLAERLGAQAARDAADWAYTPGEYAERYAELVERAIGGRGSAC